MAGIGWIIPLSKKLDISLALNWWKPWNKIELRRSFYFNREALEQDTEVVFSYVLAFICVSVEFEVYRNGGIDD